MIDIHPKSLEKLGKLDSAVAKRLLKATGMFDSVEIVDLIKKAGCNPPTKPWTPYRYKSIDNPFFL